VDQINLVGSIELVHNAINITEMAVARGATSIMMPVSCRKQLADLSDDMATRINIIFYFVAIDALLKAVIEYNYKLINL
jgi:ATP-dependent Lon protease